MVFHDDLEKPVLHAIFQCIKCDFIKTKHVHARAEYRAMRHVYSKRNVRPCQGSQKPRRYLHFIKIEI